MLPFLVNKDEYNYINNFHRFHRLTNFTSATTAGVLRLISRWFFKIWRHYLHYNRDDSFETLRLAADKYHCIEQTWTQARVT